MMKNQEIDSRQINLQDPIWNENDQVGNYTDDFSSPENSQLKQFFEARSGSISFAYKGLLQAQQNLNNANEPSFHIVLNAIDDNDKDKEALAGRLVLTNLKTPRRPSFQHLNIPGGVNCEDSHTPMKSCTRISTNFSKHPKVASVDDKKNISSASLINRQRRASECTECNYESLLEKDLNPITPVTLKKNFSAHDEIDEIFDFEPDDENSHHGRTAKKNFTSAIIQSSPGHYMIVTPAQSNRAIPELSDVLTTNINKEAKKRLIRSSQKSPTKSAISEQYLTPSIRVLNYRLIRKNLKEIFTYRVDKSGETKEKRKRNIFAFLCSKKKEKPQNKIYYIDFLKNIYSIAPASTNPETTKLSNDLVLIYEELLRQAYSLPNSNKEIDTFQQIFFDLSSNIVKDINAKTRGNEKSTNELLELKRTNLLNSTGVLGIICLIEFVAENFRLFNQISEFSKIGSISVSVMLLEIADNISTIHNQTNNLESEEESLQDFICTMGITFWILLSHMQCEQFLPQNLGFWRQKAINDFFRRKSAYKSLLKKMSGFSVQSILTEISNL